MVGEPALLRNDFAAFIDDFDPRSRRKPGDAERGRAGAAVHVQIVGEHVQRPVMFAGEFMKPLLDMIERPAGIGQAPCPFGPPQAPAGDAPDTPPAPPGARREFHFAPRTLVFLEGDEARSLLLVKGAVPGAKTGFVTVHPAVRQRAKKGAK